MSTGVFGFSNEIFSINYGESYVFSVLQHIRCVLMVKIDLILILARL